MSQKKARLERYKKSMDKLSKRVDSLLTEVKRYTASADCNLPEPSYTACELLMAWGMQECVDEIIVFTPWTDEMYGTEAAAVTWLTDRIINLPNHDDGFTLSKYKDYLNGDRGLDTSDLELRRTCNFFFVNNFTHTMDRFIDPYKENGFAGISDAIKSDALSEDEIFTIFDELRLSCLASWYFDIRFVSNFDHYQLDNVVRFFLCVQIAIIKCANDEIMDNYFEYRRQVADRRNR